MEKDSTPAGALSGKSGPAPLAVQRDTGRGSGRTGSMSGHGKARDDKRKKRIRTRRNAETAQAHKLKNAQTPPGATT